MKNHDLQNHLFYAPYYYDTDWKTLLYLPKLNENKVVFSDTKCIYTFRLANTTRRRTFVKNLLTETQARNKYPEYFI